MTRDAPWFVADFLPRWLDRVRAPDGSVAEALDRAGTAVPAAPTTLTHARLVFTLAHLHLTTRDPRHLHAARAVHEFLDRALRDPRGGYRASTADPIRRSYDQSFALLALVTLRRADPEAVPAERIDALWRFVEDRLTEPATGALWEDDRGAASSAVRAQNPHMHMLEAVLQAFEMTGDAIWMGRAAALVRLARATFFDPRTGAVREFVGSDLAPLADDAGARREPGHQYEWAWLLHRFADLGGTEDVRDDAGRMFDFARTYGSRGAGVMAGAPFDALDGDGRVIEDTHLLWPLTEMGKFHAAAGSPDLARAAAALVFGRYFADGPEPVWVNRLDGGGRTNWPTALSRLVYHVALLVTEGARAGLWPLATTHVSESPEEERNG